MKYYVELSDDFSHFQMGKGYPIDKQQVVDDDGDQCRVRLLENSTGYVVDLT